MRRHSLGFLGVLALVAGGTARGDESAAPAVPAAEEATGSPATVFPIPGDERAEPHFAEGKFGAFRPGRRQRHDCGRGHCGIDLIAHIGTPVIAVRDGTVAQIDYSANGEGGRWVRIDHGDGTCTWYMHLAHIRKGLETGTSVKAGEQIATLGRTGVLTSPTHLHFALTVGLPGREKHLDPKRFLDAAALLAAPLYPEPVPPPKIQRSKLPEL